MANDIQDRIGQILGSDSARALAGTAVTEALKAFGSHGSDNGGGDIAKKLPGKGLSGVRGLAAGAGAAAVAPVAAKGIGKLIKGNGVPSLGNAVPNLAGGPKKLAEGAASKLGESVGGKVTGKIDEAGGPSGILKDTVKSALPFGGGGAGKQDAEGVGKGRRMPIQQQWDIGLPLETVYNQWTQFEEWPKFMHRVTRVSQEDACTVSFTVKVWGKTKEFKAQIETQRPNDRIKWKTTEGMNHTGVVVFRELGPNLTRVMLSFDLNPGGLLEKYARGARYVKRAARADFHRLVAFIEMLENETGAWRGVIEDGELVEDHDPSYDEEREYGSAEDIVHGRDSDEDDDSEDEEDEDDEDDDEEEDEKSTGRNGGEPRQQRRRSSSQGNGQSSRSRQASSSRAQSRSSGSSRTTGRRKSTQGSASSRSSSGGSTRGRSSSGSRSAGKSAGTGSTRRKSSSSSSSGSSRGRTSSGSGSSGKSTGSGSTRRKSSSSSSGGSSSGNRSSRAHTLTEHAAELSQLLGAPGTPAQPVLAPELGGTTMAIDLSRIIQAAAQSALEDKSPTSKNRKQGSEQGDKRGITAPRAFLIGAGLVTAGRLVAGSRGRDMLESLQERLTDYEQRHFGSDDGDEYEDEEPRGLGGRGVRRRRRTRSRGGRGLRRGIRRRRRTRGRRRRGPRRGARARRGARGRGRRGPRRRSPTTTRSPRPKRTRTSRRKTSRSRRGDAASGLTASR